MKIELITSENNLLEKGIEYFWKQWGNDSNFNFYKDCIQHSYQQKLNLSCDCETGKPVITCL